MTVSFGTVSLRVRYDRSAVGETDRVRLYRYDGAGSWQIVGTTDGTSDVLITSSPLSPLSAGDGYLGWFAVVDFPRTGTLIKIN